MIMILCTSVEGVKPVAAALEDERAANPEPVKLAASVNLKAMNPEPITPPPGEFLPTPRMQTLCC